MAYPVLAAQNTWWKPNVSSVTRASITEIEIMDSYTPDSTATVVDSWDASAAQDGSITCYVIGTKLIMAGDGSGKIAANEDSFSFGGVAAENNFFVAMTTFNGTSFLDVSNVTNMRAMFFRCESLVSIDVSSWDVSNVTNMSTIFARCYNLNSVEGINKWNTSSVTDMSMMFVYDNSLSSIDLSDWDTSNVTNLFAMFMGCTGLISINGLNNWNVSKATSLYNMFLNCQSLTSLDLSNWDVSKVDSMTTMFDGCGALESVGDLSNWNVSNVTTMNMMFQECSKLTGIGGLANWDVSNVTDMSFMFWGASSIGEIDVSKWDVSKVTSIDHFAAHAGLRRKGIENWNTSSLINANAAFHNCAEEELDLSGWDVSKVQFFCQMFENSPNLKRIKGLENWNTSNAVGFDQMFGRCYALEELDLSAFDTTKAKNNVQASTNGHKTMTLWNFCNDCRNLKWIKLGPNFSINGDGTNTTAANKLILPTPSTDYIDGADGNWYAFNGDPYAPNAIKDRTAETYFASFDLCADQDVLVKNGSMIETARAIREKNGTNTRYIPSQFGDAIRSIS